MAVHSNPSGGSRLATPNIAIYSSGVLVWGRWDDTSSVNSILSHRGSGYVAWTLTPAQAVEINSSAGSAQTEIGKIKLGKWYAFGWSVDASGNMRPFIASLRMTPSGPEPTVWFAPNTTAVPNDTAEYTFLGLKDFGFEADGAVQQVTVWNREITVPDIEAAMMLGSGAPAGCWAHYPMVNTSTVLSDTSGNGRNLTSQTNAVTSEPSPAANPPDPTLLQLKIICTGNSLTEGPPYGTAPAYPEELEDLRPSDTVVNAGIASENVEECRVEAYNTVLPNWNDSLTNVVCFFEWTNDAIDGFTGSQCADRYTDYVNFIQARGWYCLIGTGIAFVGGNNTQRAILNGLLLGGATSADGIANNGAIPALSDPTDAAYFTDGVHCTGLGYIEIANGFNDATDAWLATFAGQDIPPVMFFACGSIG